MKVYLATSVLDIEYRKLCIGVASQVAKRLKSLDLRKLGNENKISKLGGDTGAVSSLPF